MLINGSHEPNVLIFYPDKWEVEAIKLFTNTCLAMWFAFFNELDSYASTGDMYSHKSIQGVGINLSIGTHYNNPSF
jgi:UDPglucose 6-dehydrogenase